MTKKLFGSMACLIVASMMLALSGCDKDRHEEVQVYVEPPKPNVISEEAGVKFSVLQQGSVIASNIDGWKALSPELFNKLTGITVKAPDEDKTYHAGYGFITPLIEKSEKYPERKMAKISANSLVPKDLNGWAAVDNETLEMLGKKFLETPEPKK